LHDTIAQLDSLGFWLLPLKEKDKRPLIDNWTKRPRIGVEGMRGYLADNPGMNIGTVLGKEFPAGPFKGKRLYCVDFDIRTTDHKIIEKARNRLESFFGDFMSETIMVESGRGGGSAHYYFIHSGEFRSKSLVSNLDVERVKVLAPSKAPTKSNTKDLSESEIKAGYRTMSGYDISFLGLGAQTVLPPSIHPDTGKPYVTDESFTDLREFDPSGLFGEVVRTVNAPVAVHAGPFESVDLEAVEGLTPDILERIKRPKAGIDRSEEIMSLAVWLVCNTKLNPTQIASVLADKANGISQKAFEQRGDQKGAFDWTLKYTVQKAYQQHAVDANLDAVQASGFELLWDIDGGVVRNKDTGRPIRNDDNLHYIMQNDPALVDLFQFNTFAHRIEVIREFEWFRRHGCDHEPFFNDAHIVALRAYYHETCGLSYGVEKIHDAVERVASKLHHHPIRDYLNSQSWDGKGRLREWLPRVTGCLNTDLNREIGFRFLLAMVWRAMRPGCKFDAMLILEGRQGIGKNLLLNRLALGPQNVKPLQSFHDIKMALENLDGAWIAEVEELGQFKRAHVDDKKSFITRQVDTFRRTYARTASVVPRQFVLVGTTNENDYLRDKTGNRRFWPIRCEGQIDLAWMDEHHGQLFAEAMEYFKFGMTPELPKEFWADQEAEASGRVQLDEDINAFIDYVARLIADGEDHTFIEGRHIWDHVLRGAPRPYGNREGRRVAELVRSVGYESARRKINGRTRRGFELKHQGMLAEYLE
jgi:predicted P-loop ATPase